MDASSRIGQSIAGRYRILRQVAEGGVGTVYEAEQTLGSSLRAVAIKLLRPEWSHDAAVQARFHREAALVARLQHPNTVRIYDFGTAEDGTLFIAMEYLRGRSLQRLLDERGAQPPERAQRIITQVAAALQEAHELGIVHRDLKPDNILILDNQAGERDVVKLVDFGIARGQPSSGSALTKLTALGTFVGTPAYMSPEQFSGGGAGPQSDIYSLGVTSHQLLAGRLPFDAQTPVQWAQAHLATPPPALEGEYGAGPIPEHMRRAVARALAKEPAERPASAALFAEEFSGARRGMAAAPVMAPPLVAPPVMAPPRVEAVPPAARHTAPMTRVPDVEERSPGLAPTLPNAALPAPPTNAPVRSAHGQLRLIAVLAAVTALGFTSFALYGQRFGFWPRPRAAEPPAQVGLLPAESATEPAPVVIEPEPSAAPAPSRAPSDNSARPSAALPPARPTRPAPAPTPPVAPSAVPAAPGLPTPPAVPPASSPTPLPLPGLPPTAPGTGVPSLPPGLQLPPFNLPTQGACERCLEALRKGGSASVVSAAAEDLLCDDRQGRERCENQIRELAPAVAEQAAHAGDCPAALATEAAGVHLGVDQERFRGVNALCVR